MKLTQLLKSWGISDLPEVTITGLENDSREVKSGDLFIAYPGCSSDGRDFMSQAQEKGAIAVLYEPYASGSKPNLPDLPCIPFTGLAENLARLASRFYQHPSRKLQIIGVTGTNGKTTIAYQLAQATCLLGQKAAYLGTLGEGMVGSLNPLANTTPDGLTLQRVLAGYVANAINSVCMEVSSHALSLHRVDEVFFTQAIFTNLTLDHLDFHKTMESYAQAKAMLFARPELQWAIINGDDPYAKTMSASVKEGVRVLDYGFSSACQVRVTDSHMDLNGSQMQIESPWGNQEIQIQSLGKFNFYNTLAVYSSLLASGYPLKDIAAVMRELKPAPGRLEIVATHPYVVVDYAHTPDALINVMTTLNQLKKGKLWVVFGCGGDRDKSKRPVMGGAARQYGDEIIVTSDNPRTEDPEQIIADIIVGISDVRSIKKETDRARAIEYAITQASPDDIILIAGKGHESYQQIGKIKYHFSDQEVVRAILEKVASH